MDKNKQRGKFFRLDKLDINNSSITGEIIWTYEAIDSANDNLAKYYAGQKGKRGIEYLKGNYSRQTFDIQVEGFSKTDPDLVIGMDNIY